MKLNQVSTAAVIHPDVKGLVIDGRAVCPNGKILDYWEGDFIVDGDKHQVSSLDGCPRVITDNFQVINQKHLTSLNGSPEKANDVYVCKCPALQDLTGIPLSNDYYWIERNDQLLSLDGIPTHLMNHLEINGNPKLSFTVCQFPSIRSLYWENNKDVSLHDFHRYFPKISNRLIISKQIQSHVLSVLLIEGLQEIKTYNDRLKPMIDIINQHLPNTTGKKGMLRCQAALIDAGYAVYAQL